MPRNPLLDAKRVHTVKVCFDDAEMADLGSLASAEHRSPSQQAAHMLRTSMYGRIGQERPGRQRTSEAQWGRVTMEEVGFSESDFQALAELGRRHRQAPAAVLVQLVRVGLFGRVLNGDEEADAVDSLFGDGVES
jgi:hypothetical protein